MMRGVAIQVALVLFFAGQAWAQTPPEAQAQPEAQAPVVPPIEAVYLSGAIPAAPDHAGWKDVPERQIALTPQIITPPNGGGSVQMVSVRAVHNGSWIAFRLEWTDATANREVGVDEFRDAAAVGFPTRDTEVLPAPFMGDVYNSLNIWQWTADFDANAQGAGGFSERYPHTEGVWYFAHDYDVQREVRAWRGTEPVIEYVAHGFGTLHRKAAQNVRALARRVGDHWQVVLRRELATGNPEDTLFRPGESTHAVFAVWNGENGEVNGRKNVTLAWTPLTLQPSLAVSR